MIKHIVMFKLRGTAEERLKKATEFKDALMALPEKIECLESMEVGLNENPEENWTLVLTALVKDWKALSEYSSHPLHVAAAGIIRDCKVDRSCVDYIV